jgi:hypothetical protein
MEGKYMFNPKLARVREIDNCAEGIRIQEKVRFLLDSDSCGSPLARRNLSASLGAFSQKHDEIPLSEAWRPNCGRIEQILNNYTK